MFRSLSRLLSLVQIIPWTHIRPPRTRNGMESWLVCYFFLRAYTRSSSSRQNRTVFRFRDDLTTFRKSPRRRSHHRPHSTGSRQAEDRTDLEPAPRDLRPRPEPLSPRDRGAAHDGRLPRRRHRPRVPRADERDLAPRRGRRDDVRHCERCWAQWWRWRRGAAAQLARVDHHGRGRGLDAGGHGRACASDESAGRARAHRGALTHAADARPRPGPGPERGPGPGRHRGPAPCVVAIVVVA